MPCQRAHTDPDNLRALRAQEKALLKVRTEGGDLKVHFVYPNSYWVAMSNLGYQAVYALFGTQDGVAVERGFLPEEKAQSAPIWRTFEKGRPLVECDLLAFSLSFETDYPHIIKVLKNAGVLNADPLDRAARADRGAHQPLILVGGTAVTLNPEPIADLADVIFLGEAEEFIPELTAELRRAKHSGWSREELLLALSKIEGVYVPRYYTPAFAESGHVSSYQADPRVPKRPQRRFVKDLSRYPTHSKILTPETEFKSMFLTETGRGCEMGCRFCVAGYIYRPVRKRSEQSIADTVQVGLENADTVGFVGAAVSSHRAISKLASQVAASGKRASLSSLMSQMVNRELAASISENEYKTVALAPEAGTERLRRAAGKRVANEQVLNAARELAEAGISGFKLYFIVGLPTETDADTEAIADLSIRVRDTVCGAAREQGRSAWVVLSINPFIPKASTPFQWEPMLDRKSLERKIEVIRERVRREPGIEMRFETPLESYFQALMSRGDRRVLRYLLRAEEQGRDWKWLMRNRHEELAGEVPPIDFYVARRFGFDELLPWEVVDSRIDKSLLLREAMRAHRGEGWGRGAAEESESEIPQGGMLDINFA